MHGYQLAMIRFHWSTDDTTGSEHQVDGESYPLEVGHQNTYFVVVCNTWRILYGCSIVFCNT